MLAGVVLTHLIPPILWDNIPVGLSPKMGGKSNSTRLLRASHPGLGNYGLSGLPEIGLNGISRV